jgi:hypothetical protein
LPVSLGWQGKDPYAVIETISAWELMIAAAWSDVVSRAEEQVCARCGTRFTVAPKEKALPVGMWTFSCRSQVQKKKGTRKAKAEGSREGQILI